MKCKLLLISVILLSFNTINAQTELWGMSSEGGKYGVGTIFKTDGDGNNYELQHSFFASVGRTLQSPLTEASNGKLYGLASDGAVCSNNGGVLYEYDIITNLYDVKYSFEDTQNGTYPQGKLLYATNGKLYGTTKEGGANDEGVIFEFDPLTETFVKIFDFDVSNGKYANALMQADNGLLYGTTSYGGDDDKGVIFQYNISDSTYTKLFDFDDDNGSRPAGAFVQVSADKLYGLTYDGGGNYYGGTIYEFDISSNTHLVKKVLASYVDSIGGSPSSSMTLADNGKLYGIVAVRAGNVGTKLFEYDVEASSYTLLDLSGNSYLGHELLAASNGKLYGAGSAGGDDNHGVIFEYDMSSSALTKLYSFNNDDGSGYNSTALMQASNGKLYACTRSGGESLWEGGLYEFDITNESYTKKFDFDVSKYGSRPGGGLIQASNNKLYGMTRNGGTYIESDYTNDRYGAGTIFEFDPVSRVYTVLFEFDGENGNLPQGDLLQASNGKLYGLTYSGGIANWGVMFEFDIVTNSYEVLYDFDINGDRENGAYPTGTLMQANDGKIYGFTSRGGVLEDGTRVDYGTVFAYDISADSLTTIHTFDDINGSLPYSKLIQSQNGLLYGLTAKGGGYGNLGTLFSYDYTSSTYTKLYSFSQSDHYNPLGALTEVILSDSINLFGVTSAGGGGIENDAIFKYNVSKDELSFVKEFDGYDGGNPLTTTLCLASNGNLYGAGPINDTEYKFMFQYNVETNALESKYDFTCKKPSTRNLYVGELIEIDANYTTPNDEIKTADKRFCVYPNPVHNTLNISSEFEISHAKLYNHLGQIILSVASTNTLDVSGLQAGIYILRVEETDGKINIQKIIKD